MKLKGEKKWIHMMEEEWLDRLIEAAVFEMNKTLNSDGAKVVAV